MLQLAPAWRVAVLAALVVAYRWSQKGGLFRGDSSKVANCSDFLTVFGKGGTGEGNLDRICIGKETPDVAGEIGTKAEDAVGFGAVAFLANWDRGMGNVPLAFVPVTYRWNASCCRAAGKGSFSPSSPVGNGDSLPATGLLPVTRGPFMRKI